MPQNDRHLSVLTMMLDLVRSLTFQIKSLELSIVLVKFNEITITGNELHDNKVDKKVLSLNQTNENTFLSINLMRHIFCHE